VPGGYNLAKGVFILHSVEYNAVYVTIEEAQVHKHEAEDSGCQVVSANKKVESARSLAMNIH